MSMKDLDAATQLVHAGRDWDPEWGCVNPPVVRASTVLHKSCEDMMDRVHDEMACRDGKPCYGSYGGPAHKAFYSAMKTLEGPNAAGAWAFSTGLAATTTPLFAFVRAGCHALFSDSIYGPTREFAEQILPQSVSRAAITAAWRRPETDAVPMLLEQARLPQSLGEQAHKLAYQLAEKLRNQKTASGRAGMVQSLLQEFSLSSQEGVALMCLAEALLRIPDKATRDALIRDKISNGNWQSHIGRSPSLFVNAATWGLLFTGKLVSTHNETSLSRSLNRIIGKFNGKFGLWQKLRLMWDLKVRRSCDRIFGIIFGIAPEFHGKGVESAIMVKYYEFLEMTKNQYKSMELAWIGDFNPVMNRMIETYVCATKHKMHTTYRYLFDREKEFRRCPRLGVKRRE